jgi:hypothetical protein
LVPAVSAAHTHLFDAYSLVDDIVASVNRAGVRPRRPRFYRAVCEARVALRRALVRGRRLESRVDGGSRVRSAEWAVWQYLDAVRRSVTVLERAVRRLPGARGAGPSNHARVEGADVPAASNAPRPTRRPADV